MANTPVDPGFNLVKPKFGGAFDGRNTPGAGGGLGGAYATPGDPLSGPNGTPGSGTNTNQPSPPTVTDWADAFWGSLGLPSSLITQINQTIGKYTDPAQAQAIGQQLLRNSDWYKATFPGIAYGIQHGLFTDETGYRDYVNQLNNLYQQYYGRAVTSDEISGYLQNGKTASYVGNVFQGNAIAQTERPEAQYESGAFGTGRLSDAELQAYGQEKAGIDTPLGQQVMLRLQQASQRMQKIFEGTLAKPGFALGPAGVYSPLLQGARENTSTPSGTTNLPT